MTPLELFGIIALLGVIRIVLALRPVLTSPSALALPAIERDTASRARSIAAINEYLDAFIVAGLVALFLITFVVRTFFIPSGSMEPTLQIGDELLANEFEYKLPWVHPSDGDIVIFWPPVETKNDFIKRLMGSPGDTLRVHGGIVYRNGVALKERYIAERPNYELAIKNYGIYIDGVPLDPGDANIPPRSRWTAPDRIPAGYYYMMGDNRNDSEDSHVWGFAQRDGTFATGPQAGKPAGFTGRAFLVFWPLHRIRILQ